MIFNLLKKIAVILLLIIITLAFPNKSKAFNLFENEDCCEIDVWDLTIDDNIKYPNLPVNVATQIKNHIHNEELHLKRLGYNTKLIRNDEVIMLNIPIDKLYPNNRTKLQPQNCDKLIKPLSRYLKIKGMYRIIYAVHHDNSSSSADADSITNIRVLEIVDYTGNYVANSATIIPYSMGNDFPLSYITKENDKNNRRLEIFIIPGEILIELAAENQLKF